jgi:xanthine dehydrogenase YagR molybdenum-binding subunit
MKAMGLSFDRVDGAAKVSGSAAYAADVRFEGQLYALALRSTVAAGRIGAIDTAAAAAVPGVKAIYTHENAGPELGWRISDELIALSGEGLGLTALAAGGEPRPKGYLPLTSPAVHFAGQWIALVVAETLEVAREALGRIKVVYDEAPASVAVRVTDDALAPGFFFGAEMQVTRGTPGERRPGDHILSETYTTAMQLHQPMEPSVTTAHWCGGEMLLHDSTQGVYASRDYVATSLGIPKEQVRVISAYVGGGFGAKNQMWPHQALAAHVARALGRPVRLQLTRADMAVASGHRSETEQQVMLHAAADGSLLMLRHISHVPTSRQGGFFEPCGLNSLLLYRSDAVEVRHHVHRKNIATPTPFRAPGETPGSFAVETALDELACRLGIDPLEIRRRTFPQRDAYHNRPWSSNQLLKCYEIGAERFGWPAGPVIPRARREGNELVGYGVATTAYPAPALTATVRLRLSRQGRIVVETAATDIGTGMYTILAQTVADDLAVPMADITVKLGDSSLPYAPTAGRSKSTASVLPAARRACQALRDKLRELGGQLPMLGNVALSEFLDRAEIDEIVVEGTSGGMPQGQQLSFYSFGAHFVEVRVDEELGRIRVSRVVSAFDCGRIVNPKTAASQLKGGIVFGIGMALMEKAEFDPDRCRLVNDNLGDYHVPVNADVRDIDVLFVENPDLQFNDLGVRGLGEIALPGTAAAIGNALFSATGVRVRRLPIAMSDILPM